MKPDFLCNLRLCKAAKQFPFLSMAANNLLSEHASAAAEWNWSAWGRIYAPIHNSLSIERAENGFMSRQTGLQLGTARNSKADSVFLFDMEHVA